MQQAVAQLPTVRLRRREIPSLTVGVLLTSRLRSWREPLTLQKPPRKSFTRQLLTGGRVYLARHELTLLVLLI